MQAGGLTDGLITPDHPFAMSRSSDLIDASFRALLAGNEGAAERYLKELELVTKLACVSKSGECPVHGCEADGECFLWRAENPHAPRREET